MPTSNSEIFLLIEFTSYLKVFEIQGYFFYKNGVTNQPNEKLIDCVDSANNRHHCFNWVLMSSRRSTMQRTHLHNRTHLKHTCNLQYSSTQWKNSRRIDTRIGTICKFWVTACPAKNSIFYRIVAWFSTSTIQLSWPIYINSPLYIAILSHPHILWILNRHWTASCVVVFPKQLLSKTMRIWLTQAEKVRLTFVLCRVKFIQSFEYKLRCGCDRRQVSIPIVVGCHNKSSRNWKAKWFSINYSIFCWFWCCADSL